MVQIPDGRTFPLNINSIQKFRMVLFSLFKGKAEKDTAALLEDIEKKLKEFKEERCTTTVTKRSACRKILYYG